MPKLTREQLAEKVTTFSKTLDLLGIEHILVLGSVDVGSAVIAVSMDADRAIRALDAIRDRATATASERRAAERPAEFEGTDEAVLKAVDALMANGYNEYLIVAATTKEDGSEMVCNMSLERLVTELTTLAETAQKAIEGRGNGANDAQ